MRIAFVTVEFVADGTFHGGLANYVYRIAKSLQAHGHSIAIFISSNRNLSSQFDGIEIYEVNTHIGSSVKAFNIITRDRLSTLSRLFWQSYMLNRMVKKCHKSGPFSIIQYTNLLGVGMLRPSSIPSVVRLSSYFDLMHKHGDYKTATKNFIRQMSQAEKIGIRRANAVFGPSAGIARYVEKDLHKQIAVIPSPFEEEKISTSEEIYLSKLKGKQYLLFVGRICRLKGVFTIAEIIHPLLSKYKDLYFVFCGRDDPAGSEQSVMSHVLHNAGEFRHRVMHLGTLPHHYLYPIISHAETIILPSHIDNMPNACIEAMMLRKIVIGTKGTGGFDELIADSENGFFCLPQDSQSLLSTIENVMALSPAQKDSIGESAYQSVQRLRPETVTKQHLKFYKSVLLTNGESER